MKSKKFDAAFKQEVVNQVLEQGKGISTVAQEFGISCIAYKIGYT